MTDAADGSGADPVDRLVEQFLARCRGGAPADVEAFCAAHSEHAAQLRELLPMLVALEQVKRDRQTSTGSGTRPLSLPPLERLGDFKIVREVGRGGMGVVFEAVQESLGRQVALKVLPQASLLTGNQLQRFQREASVAAQLHHSHIVPVFGSGHSDGFHWYAMQFIRGQSLDHWRRTMAGAPPADPAAWRDRARFVARVGAQAASALHYAHGQGTLHRDVKPANLLLEHDDHVWVTDFGLAKALEAEGLTQSSDLLGTLQYMAPEQFAGQYDVRSEVYALGVTLYELLVLRAAFAGRTRSELMEQIRSLRPTPLRRACPDLPTDLALVVERAMARDPGDRYADAAALQADLQAFLDDRPIAARRHNAAQLLWRWCRRNRTVALLSACTLLAVVGAGVTGWIAYVTTDDALAREQQATARATKQGELVATNLQLTLTAFGELFDALVGRDRALVLDEDPDTGEQTVVARTVVEPRDVALLQRMLAFYDRFAAANADDQSLRFETARAHRRTAAIQARLGDLDAAAASYLQALSRLLQVEGRDVRREVVAVHVDLGQLEQRRGRSGEAAQRFRQALDLLGPDSAADPLAIRFERAQALFLLGRRGGPGGPGGRPPDRLRSEAQSELDTARRIAAELTAAEPQNPEFRALQARLQLEAARRPGGDGRPARDAALATLRTLVAEHPEVDTYRHELCEALWAEARRGPGEVRAAPQQLEGLREARTLAEELVRQQPQVLEYRLLRANIGATLGQRLVAAALVVPGDAAALRQEAELELRAALATPAPTSERDSLRQALPMLAARTALAMLLLDTARPDAAAKEAEAVLTSLQALVRDARGARRLPGDARAFELLDVLLRRLGRSDLQEQWRELRTRLPADDRSGAPPRRPR
ncbi:MAG: serine/threonine protein kinase [Planctomycetes bacterium]|nr:serine/threonine protein kinase [Planctomycetota bacterium]